MLRLFSLITTNFRVLYLLKSFNDTMHPTLHAQNSLHASMMTCPSRKVYQNSKVFFLENIAVLHSPSTPLQKLHHPRPCNASTMRPTASCRIDNRIFWGTCWPQYVFFLQIALDCSWYVIRRNTFTAFPSLPSLPFFASCSQEKPNKAVSILHQPLPVGVDTVPQNNMPLLCSKISTLQGRSPLFAEHLNVPRRALPLYGRALCSNTLLIGRPNHSHLPILLYTFQALSFHWMNPVFHIPLFTTRTEGHTIICCHQLHLLSQKDNCVFTLHHYLHTIAVFFHCNELSLASPIFGEHLRPSLPNISKIPQCPDRGSKHLQIRTPVP